MPRQPKAEPDGFVISQEAASRLDKNRYEVIGGGSRPWWPWQVKGLTCLCDEIACLGGKSGGKSELMRGWLVSGNPHLPDQDQNGHDIPWNRTYTAHPYYRGLILRKNEGDLADFIKRAARMWAPLGGEYKNGRFEFTSGAVIDVGHMKDEAAWMKYIGIEFQRIGIDEAGLIKEYSLFEELRSNMRTIYPELRCQIVLASNAGGPGTSWLIDRYMKARDKDGNIIPHDNVITEEYMHPFTGEKRTRTRIWLFSTIEDNPIYKTSDYAITLMSLSDPKLRRAYFEGHWDALFGSYFGDLFRPDGPIASNNEPPNANHVLKPVGTKYPVDIKPWHRITMGGDWGYTHEAAFLWGRELPDKRLIIYRELVANQTSPEKLGYEIARQSREELEALPSHSFTLWLGHDAFNARAGDRSIAELIALGIARVLGPKSVHLPDLIIRRLKESYERETYNVWDDQKRQEAMDQIRMQRNMGITIRIAEKTGVIGWQYCRELMQWDPIGAVNVQPDQELIQKMLREDLKAFEEYTRTFRNVRPEPKPRLQIFDCCPRLIHAIPKAQHEDGTENIDKNHFIGKDVVDCFSYLVSGLMEESPAEPFEAFRERRLEEASNIYRDGLDCNDLCRINRALEAEWKEKDTVPAPITPPRATRARRLMLRGKISPLPNIDKVLAPSFKLRYGDGKDEAY